MVDVAEPEAAMEDTGVHMRRRAALIAHAAELVERVERIGSDRPPPAPSEPPTFRPVERDDEDERDSLH